MFARDEAAIATEARLDGVYVLRTPVPQAELDADATVRSYKALSTVENDQSWCLSRCNRRQSPPWRRRRADGAQGGNRLGVGVHQLGNARADGY